jgi:maleate isomerase
MNGQKSLGLLVPSTNTTMERDLTQWMPSSVGIYVSRMPIQSDVTPEALIAMSEASVDSIRLLKYCRLDLVLYGCTSGSFIKGGDFHKQVEANLASVSGFPVLSTSHCILEALNHLGCCKVAVFTPYVDAVNLRAQRFLEENGFSVTAMYGMGLIDNWDVGQVDTADVFKFIYENDRKGADTVFIACTNLPTLDIVHSLSRVIGLPVFSSNQASIWGCLNRLGMETSLEAIGF